MDVRKGLLTQSLYLNPIVFRVWLVLVTDLSLYSSK